MAYGQKVPLTCLGRFKASLKAGMMTIHSFVYVIKGQAESLLGRKSCFDLGIFKQVEFVKQTNSNSTKINDPRLNSLVTYTGASFPRELHRPYEESRMVYDVG